MGRPWPISATLWQWLTFESELDAPDPIIEKSARRKPGHGALVWGLVSTPDATAKLS